MRFARSEFGSHVPELQAAGLLPRGLYKNTEGTTQDQRAGLDGFIQNRATGAVWTIAHRIYTADWGSITLREVLGSGGLTEIAKNGASVRDGGSVPLLNVHLYLVDHVLVQAFVLETEAVYRHIIRRWEEGEPVFCTCVGNRMPSGGGDKNWFRAVAITRAAALRLGTRDTLPGHGVPVKALHAYDEQVSLALLA